MHTVVGGDFHHVGVVGVGVGGNLVVLRRHRQVAADDAEQSRIGPAGDREGGRVGAHRIDIGGGQRHRKTAVLIDRLRRRGGDHGGHVVLVIDAQHHRLAAA